jgi:hypothetical protein
MLWPRMPAGERIADWVTWNLFLFLARLPNGRGSEPRASSTHGDDRKSCTGEHRLEEDRVGGASASGTGYRNCPINGAALRFT